METQPTAQPKKITAIKRYYLKNRDKILEQKKDYYERNKERSKQRSKEYYQKRKEEKEELERLRMELKNRV